MSCIIVSIKETNLLTVKFFETRNFHIFLCLDLLGIMYFNLTIYFQTQDSDCEDKSLSQDDSLDGMSDIMCGENYNTLKKGPHWNELPLKYSLPIEPPLEFQDKPVITRSMDSFVDRLVIQIMSDALKQYADSDSRVKLAHMMNVCIHKPLHHLLARTYWTSDFLSFSPCHAGM